MYVQVTLATECLPTHITDVRMLTSIYMLVSPLCTVTNELLVTDMTNILAPHYVSADDSSHGMTYYTLHCDTDAPHNVLVGISSDDTYS